MEESAVVTAPADSAMSVLPSHDPNAPAAPAAAAETDPATPAVVQEAPKVEDKTAGKFAALSRKEREIRQQQKALKEQQATIAKQLQEFEQWKKEREDWSNQFKQDPLEALKKQGISYEDLTTKYLLKGEETPEQKTTAYIKALEDKLTSFEQSLKQKEEADKKKEEELKAQQIDAAKNNYLKGLTDFVNKNPEKYELIIKNDAVGLIFEVIESHYDQTAKDAEDNVGVILSQDEAAQAVEDYLLEEAKKLIESNKIKKLAAPQAAATPSASKPSATLSNNPASVVPTTGSKILSDDESKRQMAAMLKWHT